jgi:hypothetical protein
MTDTVTTLTEDEFNARFPLIENHLNPQATWAFGDGRGCLFETYGEEFEFVRRQNLDRIWTLVDSDDGDCYVVSGLHVVNRIGYLIGRDPVPSGTAIEVHIPMSIDEFDDLEKSQS